MKKRDSILAYLKTYGRIDYKAAIKEFNCRWLSQIINELRCMGYNITAEDSRPIIYYLKDK